MNRNDNFKRKGFTLIELIIVVVILVVIFLVITKGCKSIPFISKDHNTRDDVKVSYSPPLIPLQISETSRGKLSVSVGSTLVTPIGTFSAEWERKRIYYLEVTLGNETRFYPLGKRKLKLTLPNTLEGISTVRYDGEGNIRIIVPKPGKIHF